MNKKAKIIVRKIEGQDVSILAKEVSVVSSFKVLDDTKGIFEAYVSVFGNVDSYGEVVDKGAFVGWLEKYKGRYPKGVWAHNWDEPIIKTLEIYEDEIGLKVKGQFVLAVQRAAEIYALMKEGVITDFSFGFRVLNSKMDPETNALHLTEIAIYEYSPVLVGANSAATLIDVKADGKVKEGEEGAPAAGSEGGENTAAGDPAPEAGAEAPAPAPAAEDAGGESGGSSDPAPEAPKDAPKTDPAPGEGGKAGVATSKKAAMATAIDALKKATDALEALNEATEDEALKGASDTSTGGREGKDAGDRIAIKGILRDARKADKIIESVILRAKTITKSE